MARNIKQNYFYDSNADSLYIAIKSGQEERFEEIIPGVNLEFDNKDNLIGIEILNASKFASHRIPNKSATILESIKT